MTFSDVVLPVPFLASLLAFTGFLEGKKYTPKVFSALKLKCLNRQEKRFGVYQKASFQGKEKENTYTPKSLQGVCGERFRAVLVYRFRPPNFPLFYSNFLSNARPIPVPRPVVVSLRFPSLSRHFSWFWGSRNPIFTICPFQAQNGHFQLSGAELSFPIFRRSVPL